MANTLVSPHGIAPKNLPPINPWLIRTAIFVLGLVFVMTPFWAWFSDTKPHKPVVASQVLLNHEMERVNEVLSSDDRFKGIRIYLFEDPVPTICMTGKVANEEDLYQLKESVGFLRLKVKAIWMVASGSPKISDAIP